MSAFVRSLIPILRDIRLVPVVLVATIALFSLKSLGLILDSGYLLDGARDDDVEITGAIGAQKPAAAPAAPAPAPAPMKQSWAHEMFNYPDVTGAVGAPPAAAPNPEAPPAKPAAAPSGEAPPAKPEPAPNAAAAKKPLEPPPTPGGTPVLIDP